MSIQVIVHKGKHSTDCYDASTPEAWAASCVELLEPYRSQAVKDNAYKKQRYEEAVANNEQVTEIRRIIAEDDRSVFVYGAGTKRERSVPIAWEILERRRDYEYEHVSLDTVWTAPEVTG